MTLVFGISLDRNNSTLNFIGGKKTQKLKGIPKKEKTQRKLRYYVKKGITENNSWEEN